MKRKKHLVIIPDGLADYPLADYGNKTIMEIASTPYLDRLAAQGLMGTVQTIPDDFPPGSDVANMNIMGYDPRHYYTGRASIEALSLGIRMQPNQLAFRMNLVDIENGIMKDYSGHHISTEDAGAYIELLQKKLQNERYSFYKGTSYRHIFLLTTDEEKAGTEGIDTTPPHDISGKETVSCLPKGKYARELNEVIEKSGTLFAEHRQELPGNITHGWVWGEGVTPKFTSFCQNTGLKGGIVTAVDLLKGIAVGADMEILDVPGITGFIDTNYKGKIEKALQALNGSLDYVYLHVEAPDESGHVGNVQYKIQSLEDIDRHIFKKVVEELEDNKDFNVLIMPDHFTPVALRTHTRDPVPFLMLKNFNKMKSTNKRFTELNAQKSNMYFETCSKLLQEFYS